MLITLRMRLPVWPIPAPLRTRSANAAILSKDGMDLGHHILSVVDDGRTSRHAQGDMKHRAILRGVDLVAAKHRVDAIPQPRLLGKLQPAALGVSSVIRFFE